MTAAIPSESETRAGWLSSKARFSMYETRQTGPTESSQKW